MSNSLSFLIIGAHIYNVCKFLAFILSVIRPPQEGLFSLKGTVHKPILPLRSNLVLIERWASKQNLNSWNLDWRDFDTMLNVCLSQTSILLPDDQEIFHYISNITKNIYIYIYNILEWVDLIIAASVNVH